MALAAFDNPSREAIALRLHSGAQSADNLINGLGLSVDEVRAVARRQLAGSVAAACLIVAAATLAALRPVHHEALYAASHSFPVAQQPAFATPPHHRLAAVKGGAEVP